MEYKTSQLSKSKNAEFIFLFPLSKTYLYTTEKYLKYDYYPSVNEFMLRLLSIKYGKR
jgi:hypothetical protein